MYNNIGHKIKVLAKVMCWIGIAVSVLAGIAFLIIYFRMRYYRSPEYLITAISCIVFGPLLSWLNNMLLYGFGELIDKTSAIEKNTKHSGNF